MSVTLFLVTPIAIAPALVFLFVLDRLDSFRLVSLRIAVLALLAGGVIAVASYFINSATMDVLDASLSTYTRYGAPVVEEALKASVMIYLFLKARIGFLIDAAILGFAIGTGFALFENIYFLYSFPEANLGVWIVRGFGTEMMHGGATAIFGVLSQAWTERHTKVFPLYYLPGLLTAILLHSLFNHLLASPMLATAVAMALTPLVLFMVFARSEHRIHDWLLQDHASHEQLLAKMDATFARSQAGQFISELADKFDGAHAGEIYAYMRLHTELVLRAEELLLAREKGSTLDIASADQQRFIQLHHLERKIGRTAMLALWPHLHYGRQELAELYEFESRTKAVNWNKH